MPKARAVNTQKYILEPDPAATVSFIVRSRKTGRIVSRKEVFETDLSRARDWKRVSAAAGPLKLCVEGDSWVNLLWPFSGMERTFADYLEARYPTNNLGWPGDLLYDLYFDKDYEAPIKSNTFDWFILSGGGNEIIGAGALKDFLRARDECQDPQQATDCLKIDAVNMAMSNIDTLYRLIAKEVMVWSSRTKIATHSYAYARPRQNGRWLGRAFLNKGYSLTRDKLIIEKIIAYLVDRFHDLLLKIATDNRERFFVVDVRDCVGSRWQDEIHPSATAASDIANAFESIFENAAVAA